MNRKFRRAFNRAVSNSIKRGTREFVRVCPTVNDEDEFIGFSYTVGNAARGLPELLILGAYSPDICSALHKLSEKLVERGCAFSDGEEIFIGGKFPVKIVNADERAKHEYTCAATGRFGAQNYRVQQVLAPDRDGRFPGNPDCCAPFNVPVLSPANVH
jgi:hypothetical protein